MRVSEKENSVFLRQLIIVSLTLFCSSAWGQQNETQELTATDGALGDTLGSSVSVSGELAVVGAPHDSDAGDFSGSAYVYRFDGSTWVEEAKLTASDAAAADRFGSSVSVSGNVALVGAPFDGDAGLASGSAYVYRFDGNGWVEEAKLTASDAAELDFFGTSVAVSGDLALVGAPSDDDDGLESGSAYVYRHDGTDWLQEAKLTASDATANDRFGMAVMNREDVAVIGAIGDDVAGFFSGSAYVYRVDGVTWVEEAKLTPSETSSSDRFGISVSVSGDVIVVGAEGYDSDTANNIGAAYVFRHDGSTWVEEQQLTAGDAAVADFLGISVSVSGEVVVLGAQGDDDGTPNSGSAYVFRHNGNTWVEETRLTASDAAEGDRLGVSVSLSGDVAIAGAPGLEDTSSGSAYVFAVGAHFVRGDCNDDGSLDVADAVWLLGSLFPPPGGANPVACGDSCDGNDDGVLNIADAVSLLSALFGNPPIPVPAPDTCDADPSDDSLECAGFSSCP